MLAGVHQDGSTGEPTQPCQCHSIRLGLNVRPNEMAVFYSLGTISGASYSLGNTPYCITTVTMVKSGPSLNDKARHNGFALSDKIMFSP